MTAKFLPETDPEAGDTAAAAARLEQALERIGQLVTPDHRPRLVPPLPETQAIAARIDGLIAQVRTALARGGRS